MFLAVVLVNQESASGQVNRSTWVMWFIFIFGLGSYIVVTVVTLIRNYMLMHPLARHSQGFTVTPITCLFRCQRSRLIICLDFWGRTEVSHLLSKLLLHSYFEFYTLRCFAFLSLFEMSYTKISISLTLLGLCNIVQRGRKKLGERKMKSERQFCPPGMT